MARHYASGEADEFGLIYLNTGEVVFAHAPIPFRQKAGSTPWSVDLPGTERVGYRGEQYLLIRDQANKYHERFCQASGQWQEFDTAMWEIKLPWIVNCENTLSTKVLDILELFKDGSVCFLSQWHFPRGQEIDVKSPNGLVHLVREAGSDWLDLYENGEHLGSGYYSPSVFPDRDGGMHPGWGWGQDLDLPCGRDTRSEFLVPWTWILGAALLWWSPGIFLFCLNLVLVPLFLVVCVAPILAALINFFYPALAPSYEPLKALFLRVKTFAMTFRKRGTP